MSTIKFAETQNLVAFLEKPADSERFKQIVDFLNANPIRYALTVNPTIYTSCIKQFWDSAKVKIVNKDVQIRALIDGKEIIVTEASIRCDLQFQDAEALFETMMVQALEEVGKGSEVPTDTHHIPIVTQPSFSQPQRKQEAKIKEDTEEENVVPHTEPQTEESVPITSNDPLPSGDDRMQLTELMILYTNLQKQVLDLEKAKTGENVEKSKKVAEKEVSTADLVITAGEVVTTTEDVKVTTAATTLQISKDELTLAQTLIKIKAAKPKARGAKDKGKGIMVEPEKPLKKKDQIAFDEEVARKLEAEMKAEIEEEGGQLGIKMEQTWL
nr:hypothetical protein [Tanacetum cinerariifolium]